MEDRWLVGASVGVKLIALCRYQDEYFVMENFVIDDIKLGSSTPVLSDAKLEFIQKMRQELTMETLDTTVLVLGVTMIRLRCIKNSGYRIECGIVDYKGRSIYLDQEKLYPESDFKKAKNDFFEQIVLQFDKFKF